MNEEVSLFEEIKAGLEEAIEYKKGNIKLRTTTMKIEKLPKYKGKQIKNIRKKLTLTQSIFARLLGVSVKTVEAWETGTNIPNGPAQRILNALKKDPNSVELFGTVIS